MKVWVTLKRKKKVFMTKLKKKKTMRNKSRISFEYDNITINTFDNMDIE